jgi:spermidine/putrescine transport system permease protein
MMRRSARSARSARSLATFTWAYIAWSLVPVAIAVLFSFNSGRSRSVWQGFSLRWWTGDPNASLLRDESMRTVAVNSVVLALATLVVTLPLGTAMAVGLQRWRGRGSGAASTLASAPLVTPELVLGAALLLVFTNLYAAVPLGRPAQILGHVTLNLSLVVVTVRARLLTIGSSYEEAARDLGASRATAIRLVLVPMLRPAIVAAGVVVFATSIDDFIVSSFLSSGAGSETVPVRIYGAVRGASTPALNALATLLVVISFLGLVAGGVILWVLRRRNGERVTLRDFVNEVTQADA